MKMRTRRHLAALLPAVLLLCSCAPAAEERTDIDRAGIKEISPEETQPPAMEELSIGVLYSGNENLPGDQAAIFRGTRESVNALGLAPDRVLERTDVTPEGSAAAAAELADAGCRLIFSTDEAFEAGILETAAAHPEIDFCQLGGEASSLDDLENTHNYNVRLTESYFGAGTLAALMTGSWRIGCISQAAVPEEIAEFTAFYLAAMTRNGAITMDVVYTGSDSDEDIREAARSLAALGCDVISTTIDSNAAESVCEELGLWYIGRNEAAGGTGSDMAGAAASAEEGYTAEGYDGSGSETDGYDGYAGDDSNGLSSDSYNGSGSETDGYDGYADDGSSGLSTSSSASRSPRLLVSVQADWAAYMTMACESVTQGLPIPADWSGGLTDGAVSLGSIHPNAASEEVIALTEASLENIRTRARMIFAIDGFSVNGERLTSYIGADGVDYVEYGYFHDQDPSYGGSSSVFDIIVDGITVHDLASLGAEPAQTESAEG